KPHAGAAGQDVIAGREVSADVWSAALERAIGEGGFVAQRLVEPARIVSSYVEVASGRRIERTEIETLGIFLVEGRFAGAYSRSKPATDGVVIDSSSHFNI